MTTSLPPRPPAVPLSAAPERTKTRLLELLKRHGTLTAQDIALKLEVSIPATRRHLSDLCDGGLIESRTERPSGRGRPQHVYALTENGEGVFPKTYSALCMDILRHIEALHGEGSIIKVFEARNAELAERLHQELPAHLPLEVRLEILTRRLSEIGFDAVIESDGHHLYIIQRNCPSLMVAQKYKSLCHAELQLYTLVLGQAVHREKTIACGQGVCRYRIG